MDIIDNVTSCDLCTVCNYRTSVLYTSTFSAVTTCRHITAIVYASLGLHFYILYRPSCSVKESIALLIYLSSCLENI